ncbi:MAG: helix-turn-helix domain-containing protein [Caulobacteraceae bacterium]
MVKATARSELIPTFELYEEAPAETLPQVHIETISSRSRLHDWDIRPHRHARLHQLLLAAVGGGGVRVEGREVGFAAPALIAMPAGLVHGFRFEPETEGYVLTLSEDFMAEAGLEGASGLESPLIAALGDEAAGRLEGAFAEIQAELRSPRLERSRAVAAHVALILVAAARLSASQGPAKPSADMALVARFGQLIEERLQDHWPVSAYAQALKVTERQLTGACRRAVGASPLQVVHRRLLTEAKRRLIYTGLSVGEVGFALGFRDAGYFSRFFTQREGVSPSAFREGSGA